MTTTKTPLPLGEQISCPADTATVSVTHIRSGVYRVETRNASGFVVENWTRSYGDETVARMAATRAAVTFRKYGDAESIERRRVELVAVVDFQEKRIARQMHNEGVLEAAYRDLDQIADLNELALIVELRTSLAA